MSWSAKSQLVFSLFSLGLGLCGPGPLAAFVSAGQQAGGDKGRSSGASEVFEGLEFNPADLDGPKEDVGKLAAFRLVQAIAEKKNRSLHLAFLTSCLHPEKVANPVKPEAALAARRVVQSLGAFATKGPPFEEAPGLLLGLLGKGPEDFRSTVVDALTALVLWERGRRRSVVDAPASNGNGEAADETIVARLGMIIQHNSPPSPAILEDACQVLWRGDGKSFLLYVIGALKIHRESPPDLLNLYLRELRDRLVIDFSSPEGWDAWWGENKSKTFEAILLQCQRKLSADHANAWRRTLKRLRETGDAERVLAEIEETLGNAYTLELRLAAVGALGEFADWLRDLKLPGAVAESVNQEDMRLRLLTRGCRLLLELATGTQRALKGQQVAQTALSALRRYQAVLERTPELHGAVSKLVVGRLHGLQSLVEKRKGLDAGARRELLEVVHTAGTLRVLEARPVVEGLVENSLLSKATPDLELLAVSTLSLGRLVSGSMSAKTAALLLDLFKIPPPAEEGALKYYREIRRACVNALNAEPEDESVGASIRGLFERCLAEKDRDLYIPAILGLGTLARARDAAAFDDLVAVVEKAANFETSEVVAALDSIGYVGGRGSLSQLLTFLRGREKLVAKDPTLGEYLERELLGLLKGEDVGTVSWFLQSLEQLAVEDDSLALLRQTLRFCDDPGVDEALSLQKLEPEGLGSLRDRWETALLRARASALFRDDDTVKDILAALSKFLEENPSLREKAAEVAEGLDAARAANERRDALHKQLVAAEPAEVSVLVEAFAALLGEDKTARALWYDLRWIERQLALRDFEDAQRIALCDRWIAYLRSENGARHFLGLTDGFRDRYLQRVEELKSKPESTTPPSPPGKSQ